MKKQWNGFIPGFLTALLLVGLVGGAMAATSQRQATLDYSGIKITMNGKVVTPKDANGNVVEPFAIAGTTYLPVRGIASALGLNVAWDGATQTVALSDVVSAPVGGGQQSGTVIMDKNGVKITYMGIKENSGFMGGYYINLKIENSSTKNYMVQARDISLNGIMSKHIVFSSDVAAGKIANDAILVYDLEKDGITAPITTAEFYIIVYDDNWDTFTSDVVTVNR